MMLSACLLGEEKLFCPFDNRPWKIGFEDQAKNEKIVELILKDDTIAQWKELFTLQIFDNLPISAAEFVNALEKSSKKNVPSSESLRFDLIEKDPLNIFESSFIFKQDKNAPSASNDEYNIGRVLKGKTALYYIRYSTKDANLFKQNKEDWVKRFKLAYIAETHRDQQEGKWISFTSSGVYEQGEQLSHQTEYQFIDNQKLGFSMTLPKNWTVNQVNADSILPESSNAQEALHFASPDKAINGKLILMDFQDQLPIAKASHRYFATYQKQHPQTKLVSQGSIQNIIGQEGNYFMMADGDKKVWITCFAINSVMYSLELWTFEAQFDNLKNTLESVILNFQAQPRLIEVGSANQNIGSF